MFFIQVFDNFIDSLIIASNDNNLGMISEYDADFHSPCYRSASLVSGERVEWRPFLRSEPGSMTNLESALGLTIHKDISSLFGRYFSLDLNAKTDRGKLTILQALNGDDYERLQKNLIAHVLMKRRLKQPETLFFALTDEEDVVLSIIPATSEVVLEVIGQPHKETIASKLKDFISTLEPNPKFVSL
ncbi:MAG: SecY-interacting protein [Pseudomonadota bacterium]